MRYFILLLLTIFSACKKPETEADLLASIAEVESQIKEMIRPRNCATSVEDCRVRDVDNGYGCGTTYIYNINDVNSVQLTKMFFRLEKLKRDFNDVTIGIANCFRIVPNTLYVEDCKCKAEFRAPRK